MTMMNENPVDNSGNAFWLNHADSTQAAVHLALQWLAYVYPASELQIEKTLSVTLPYADSDLSSRASQFFDTADVEDHVAALEWVASTLSAEQIPFLVETAWRLLLIDHELPAHVPLALRILGRVLSIAESQVLEIGESVFREYTEQEDPRTRAPLLPLDPRYLDRVEWRLHGDVSGSRQIENRQTGRRNKHTALLLGFFLGTVFGGLVAVALIFGPLQLGRVKVPIVLYEFAEPEPAESAPAEVVPVTPEVAATQTVIVESQVEAADAPAQNVVIDVIELGSEPAAGTETAPVESSVEAPVEADETESVSEQPAGDGERVLMEVTASILNVRESASVDAPILIKLAGGAKVWAYPDTADGFWIKVKVEGKTGFASARFLKAVNP